MISIPLLWEVRLSFYSLMEYLRGAIKDSWSQLQFLSHLGKKLAVLPFCCPCLPCTITGQDSSDEMGHVMPREAINPGQPLRVSVTWISSVKEKLISGGHGRTQFRAWGFGIAWTRPSFLFLLVGSFAQFTFSKQTKDINLIKVLTHPISVIVYFLWWFQPFSFWS